MFLNVLISSYSEPILKFSKFQIFLNLFFWFLIKIEPHVLIKTSILLQSSISNLHFLQTFKHWCLENYRLNSFISLYLSLLHIIPIFSINSYPKKPLSKLIVVGSGGVGVIAHFPAGTRRFINVHLTFITLI